jgi:hypothetical protein
VARPTGGLKVPQPTGPRFNVFVLLPGKASKALLAGRQSAGQREPEPNEKAMQQ